MTGPGFLSERKTVIKHRLEGKNPIGEADLKWIFARNCEGTEQLRIQKDRVHIKHMQSVFLFLRGQRAKVRCFYSNMVHFVYLLEIKSDFPRVI